MMLIVVSEKLSNRNQIIYHIDDDIDLIVINSAKKHFRGSFR